MSSPPSPTPTEFWGEGGIAESIWKREQEEEASWLEKEDEKEKQPQDLLISPTVPFVLQAVRTGRARHWCFVCSKRR